MAHRTPRYTSHEGYLLPTGFPREAFASALTYEARPDDLFVTTYPKCGTTWMQYIVYLLHHAGAPLPAERSMTEVFPHLEEVGREAIEALAPPRCIKTHLPLDRTPLHAAARYVYVARNPFDCAVSFFHHTRGFDQHYGFRDGRWDDYFECFLAGEVDSGDYFDHLVPWWKRRADANVHFVTYEAMIADARRAIVEIAAFLGPPVREAARSPTTLDRVVEHSSFRSMKRHPERWSSKRPDDMPGFIRKGRVGDWASLFTPSQTLRLLEKLAERTAGTGVCALWPEVIAAAEERAERS
jgi:hypothetical protein